MKNEIAEEIRKLNPVSGHENFKNIPVYDVLTERGIVKREGDKFILNSRDLTNEQSHQLSVLCDWKTENIPLQKQMEDLIRTFDKNRTLFNPDKLPEQDREKLRTEFVSDYSTKKISKLKLDEYVAGKPDPIGAVNKSTFCYRLEHKLDILSWFGVQKALDFGVYYSKEEQKYKYKGDYSSPEAIFDKIKTEIKSLIEAGGLYHTDRNIQSLLATLEKHHILSKNVQSKILSVYYPDDFVHIHSFRHIRAILESFGVALPDIQENLFLAQIQLLEIKNAHPKMKQWSVDDFSHFVWRAVIARFGEGQRGPNLFLTAYDNENLKISKRLGILGWEQRPGKLLPGDYVFVFNTSNQQIETCFKIKSMSDENSPIWPDELDAGELKYPNRWDSEIESDSLNLSLDQIYGHEPFKSDKKLFSLLIRNQFPRSLKGSKYLDFRKFLLNSTQGAVNHWIFVVADQPSLKLTAEQVYQTRMNDKFWGLNEHTPHRKHLKKGDKVIFCHGTKKFLGTATLNSDSFELDNEQKDGFSHGMDFYKHNYGVMLSDIITWQVPKKIEDYIDSLSFITDKQ